MLDYNKIFKIITENSYKITEQPQQQPEQQPQQQLEEQPEEEPANYYVLDKTLKLIKYNGFEYIIDININIIDLSLYQYSDDNKKNLIFCMLCNPYINLPGTLYTDEIKVKLEMQIKEIYQKFEKNIQIRYLNNIIITLNYYLYYIKFQIDGVKNIKIDTNCNYISIKDYISLLDNINNDNIFNFINIFCDNIISEIQEQEQEQEIKYQDVITLIQKHCRNIKFNNQDTIYNINEVDSLLKSKYIIDKIKKMDANIDQNYCINLNKNIIDNINNSDIIQKLNSIFYTYNLSYNNFDIYKEIFNSILNTNSNLNNFVNIYVSVYNNFIEKFNNLDVINNDMYFNLLDLINHEINNIDDAKNKIIESAMAWEADEEKWIKEVKGEEEEE